MFDNIKAAIEYHKEFDENILCEPILVHFNNGRREDRNEKSTGLHRDCWVEVSNP
jgi:hypothetical protein